MRVTTSREIWFLHAVWRAVAAAFMTSASGCGGETVSPNSDELMIYIAGPGVGVFELDSIQLAAAFSGGPRLRPGAVTWSVSGGGFATVSANGLVKAIRATDFDLPVDPSPSAQPTVNAQAGTHTASMALQILGWKKPRAPELDGVAYLHDEQSFTMTFPFTASGIDQAGEPFAGTGTLVLTCGKAAAGQWTVEVSPDDVDYPLIAPTRKLFSTDTVSVAFDGEAPRLERWQRVGIRLRAADGDNMVRRLLRARWLAVSARSYTSQSYVHDGSVKFSFRLGNLEQVTQAAVFRACD